MKEDAIKFAEWINEWSFYRNSVNPNWRRANQSKQQDISSEELYYMFKNDPSFPKRMDEQSIKEFLTLNK